jgi:hypothetical protein
VERCSREIEGFELVKRGFARARIRDSAAATPVLGARSVLLPVVVKALTLIEV